MQIQTAPINSQPRQYIELSKLPRVYIEKGHLDATKAESYLKTHILVFGGNTTSQGEGGQAAVFRPLQRQYGKNAIPEIPTLVAPGQPFQDHNGQADTKAVAAIEPALIHIAKLSKQAGKPLLLLADGYGTGIANLPSQPATWKMFNELLSKHLGVTHKMMNGKWQLTTTLDSHYKHMFEKELNAAASQNPQSARAKDWLARLFGTGKKTVASAA